jgi:hypothetical protein
VRVALGSHPTPLEPAPRLARALLHSGGLPGFFGHAETVRRAESLLG